MASNLAGIALPAFVLSMLAGCSSSPKSEPEPLPYNPANFLYLSKDKAYGQNQIREAFRDSLSTGEPGKPVILFVHGRGVEPHKSLIGGKAVEGRAVEKLRGAYNQPVVMFSWDSAYGWIVLDRCRPKANAEPAAERLWTVIDELSKWPTGAGRPRMVLLVHSMGNIVLENYLLKLKHEIPKGLFEAIVLSSADADNEGHDVWVRMLKQSAPVYITVNPGDDTLCWARSCRKWSVDPLGMNPGKVRVEGVRYEPFNTDAHEIFHPAKDFYTTVLGGGTWP